MTKFIIQSPIVVGGLLRSVGDVVDIVGMNSRSLQRLLQDDKIATFVDTAISDQVEANTADLRDETVTMDGQVIVDGQHVHVLSEHPDLPIEVGGSRADGTALSDLFLRLAENNIIDDQTTGTFS